LAAAPRFSLFVLVALGSEPACFAAVLVATRGSCVVSPFFETVAKDLPPFINKEGEFNKHEARIKEKRFYRITLASLQASNP
jgi:hypothetical protein